MSNRSRRTTRSRASTPSKNGNNPLSITNRDTDDSNGNPKRSRLLEEVALSHDNLHNDLYGRNLTPQSKDCSIPFDIYDIVLRLVNYQLCSRSSAPPYTTTEEPPTWKGPHQHEVADISPSEFVSRYVILSYFIIGQFA